MNKCDFENLFCGLFGFIEKQFRFISDIDDTSPRSYYPSIYGPVYFAIFAEGIALGIGGIAFWALHELIRRTYSKITRPKYYPQENARRRRLAAERRKIRRRTTLNAAPTVAELRAQYVKIRRNPKEMIRFGSMLCDLEAYVDNSLIRDEYGTITGRRPGIKGWLAKHCPEMSAHYKTIIRYKALAEKFRQAVGLADPHPAAEALGDAIKPRKKSLMTDRNGENETTVRNADKSVIYEECSRIISEAGLSEAGLVAALNRRLDPDMILAPRKKRWYGREVMTA